MTLSKVGLLIIPARRLWLNLGAGDVEGFLQPHLPGRPHAVKCGDGPGALSAGRAWKGMKKI